MPHNVDDAFTEAYRSHRIEQGDDPSTLPPPLKRRKVDAKGTGTSSSSAGGGGGGFVVDSDDNSDDDDGEKEEQLPAPDYLPFSEVPHALSILSLPSDDDGILTVFRTAAINDPKAPRRRAGAAAPPTKVISREDFLRVCDVLMDGDESQEEPTQDSRRRRRPERRPSRLAAAKQRRAVQEAQSISSDSDDVYQASEDGQDEEDDDDDDGSEQAVASSSRRRRRKRADDSGDGADEGRQGIEGAKMTAEQRDHAQGAWQLLADKLEEVYPDWDGQTIGKRELHRLAISVGEKLSEKDADEMLSLARSSFAPASSKYATRETNQAARKLRKKGVPGGDESGIGIDEFAGVLLRGRMI